MKLSIIIVNFRTAGLVLDCLSGMFKHPIASSFEIIVVDNDSGDDSRRLITEAFPQVTWIQMTDNAGFSRANNAGIRRSTGDTVLLLNSDTLPRGEDIGECYRRFRESEYVACGIQLLNADGTPQISGNFAMKGGLNYLLSMPYGGQLLKRMGEWFSVSKPHVPGKGRTVEVDWVNGAFLMVKKAAIDRAGLMDEDFFLYAEEAEWCGRLRKLGPICLYGDIEVVHLQGVTANELFGSEGKGYVNLFDTKGLQVMISNFVRIRKQFGIGWFLVQLLFYIVDIPLFFVGMLVSRLTGKTRYNWTQFRQYCANTVFVIRKSPRIIRNKPYFYKVL